MNFFFGRLRAPPGIAGLGQEPKEAYTDNLGKVRSRSSTAEANMCCGLWAVRLRSCELSSISMHVIPATSLSYCQTSPCCLIGRGSVQLHGAEDANFVACRRVA